MQQQDDGINNMLSASGQRLDAEKSGSAAITHFAPPARGAALAGSTDWFFLPFEAFERRHNNRLPLAQFHIVFVPGEMLRSDTQAPLGCIVVSGRAGGRASLCGPGSLAHAAPVLPALKWQDASYASFMP